MHMNVHWVCWLLLVQQFVRQNFESSDQLHAQLATGIMVRRTG